MSVSKTEMQEIAASQQADMQLEKERANKETQNQKLILQLEASRNFFKEQITLLQAEQAALTQQIQLLEQSNPARKAALEQLESLLPGQIQSNQAQAAALEARNYKIASALGDSNYFVSHAWANAHAGRPPNLQL